MKKIILLSTLLLTTNALANDDNLNPAFGGYQHSHHEETIGEQFMRGVEIRRLHDEIKNDEPVINPFSNDIQGQRIEHQLWEIRNDNFHNAHPQVDNPFYNILQNNNHHK